MDGTQPVSNKVSVQTKLEAHRERQRGHADGLWTVADRGPRAVSVCEVWARASRIYGPHYDVDVSPSRGSRTKAKADLSSVYLSRELATGYRNPDENI